MAEETIDKAINAGFLGKRKCITSDLKLTTLKTIDPGNRMHIYGEGSSEIDEMINQNPALGIPLDSRLPYTKAEIIWICRNEMPLKVEDVLARRTRALLLNARVSAENAAEVAYIMANELGFDLKWQNEQVESYNELVKNYIQAK
jgi:glycerol-3-phosphate dehydrogenase